MSQAPPADVAAYQKTLQLPAPPAATTVRVAGLTLIDEDDTAATADLKHRITTVACLDVVDYRAGIHALAAPTVLDIGHPHPEAFAAYVAQLVEQGVQIVTHPDPDTAIDDCTANRRSLLVVVSVPVRQTNPFFTSTC